MRDSGPRPKKATKLMASQSEPVGAEKQPSKPGEKKLQCVVVTPEKTLFDEWVDFVALPLYDGELGVLAGRAPLIGRLGFGELRTRTDEVVRRYFVDGGFAQVRHDVVTVLTQRAIPADELDAEAAARDLESLDNQNVVTEQRIRRPREGGRPRAGHPAGIAGHKR